MYPVSFFFFKPYLIHSFSCQKSHSSCVGHRACPGEQVRQGPCLQGAYNLAFFTLMFFKTSQKYLRAQNQYDYDGSMKDNEPSTSPPLHPGEAYVFPVANTRLQETPVGSLAFSCCHMLSSYLSLHTQSVSSEANKGNGRCPGQGPLCSIPWARLLAT